MAASTGWREPASPVMLSGGPREPGPPDPDAPRPFFRGFFDKIGSCLNFLCCCWLLKNCFGGPLGPPEAPRRPDPPESPVPPGRHDAVKEAGPPYCENTPEPPRRPHSESAVTQAVLAEVPYWISEPRAPTPAPSTNQICSSHHERMHTRRVARK